MRILYVNGFPDFAQATLCLLKEKHWVPHWTVEHVETCDEAIGKLHNEPFDLVISTLVNQGIFNPARKASSKYGGLDLYYFVVGKNATVREEEKIALCILTRSQRYIVCDFFERNGIERHKIPRVYEMGTPLHIIIEEQEKERLAKKLAPKRSPDNKTAEGINIPSAAVKEHRL